MSGKRAWGSTSKSGRSGPRLHAMNPRWLFAMCLGFVPAAAGQDRSSPTVPAVENASLSRVAREVLQVEGGLPVSIAVDLRDAPTLSIEMELDGEVRTLVLDPVSLRSPDYKILSQVGEDRYEEIPPTPARTYRGRVAGVPGAVVAASRLDDGLHAMIRYPDGSRRWVEPLFGRVAGAGRGDHWIYRDEDVRGNAGSCGFDDLAAPAPGSDVDSPGEVASGTVVVAELALDADVEYFQKYGSVAAVEAQLHKIINTVNVQFERDANIRHIITRIIVRTVHPDPYSSFNAGGLINQVSAHWSGSQQSVPRDVVQLFTGKDLDGATIGIAIRSGLCDNLNEYCLVESDATGCTNFACKTDISAHELGHVWSLGHCSCPGWTMNPTITEANRFHPELDIPELIAFRIQKSACLGSMDKCLATDTVDCNENGFADPCDVASQTSPDVDGNGTPDECQPPPQPLGDNTPPYKNRVVGVSAQTSATLQPGAKTAMRIGLQDLSNPVPPPGGVARDFSAFEMGATCTDPGGCVRWLGPPVTVLLDQDQPTGPTERFSRLQCTPYYHDWTTEGVVRVAGSEIMPSSLYLVAGLLERCSGIESSCDAVSPFDLLYTNRYGDVVAPFAESSLEFQPDALDIVAMLNGFKSLAGAPGKLVTRLQPNDVDFHLDEGALDITAALDAFTGHAYPFFGPCPCPSTVVCQATPCQSASPCAGGLCIRACTGGPVGGQPCTLDSHCPGATCGTGFCRDRCGRCQ